MLLVVEDRQAAVVDDGHDGLAEAALVLGACRALLAADGVRVDVVAREALDGGDQVGADALRHERGVDVRLRVHRPGAAVAAHGHTAHRFHAAGEDEVLPTARDLLRRDVDGLEARGAEPVELHASDGVRQARLERGRLGDVHALVADRADAPKHDVVDPVRIEAGVAAKRLVDQADDEVDRLDGVERTAGAPAAARGADRLEDEGLGLAHERVDSRCRERKVVAAAVGDLGGEPPRCRGGALVAAVPLFPRGRSCSRRHNTERALGLSTVVTRP